VKHLAWPGISAPAKTQVTLIDRYNKMLLEILIDPDFRKKWRGIGSEIVAGTHPQFAELTL
jgi:tripartite-type tricarboxylate transporter receptor subunit TctC